MNGKYLLVRADFVLGARETTERFVYRRWRRVLFEALPRLLGCADRCTAAEAVCLHKGLPVGRFTAWLRIPIQRRPNRKLLVRMKQRLWQRLEEGLKPVGGHVLKVGVRRYRTAILPLFAARDGLEQQVA